MRFATKALVLLAVVGLAGAAKYGEACTTDADCTGATAPICAIYFTDTSFERNTVSATDPTPTETSVRKVKGVCVECQSDCDCGVNQFCGIDADKNIIDWATVKSDNNGNGITAVMKKQIELDAKSFTGMKIRSMCRAYDVPGNRCKRYDSEAGYDNAYAQIVKEYSSTVGREVYVTKVPDINSGSIPKAWAEPDGGMFCGRVNTFATQFHTVLNLGDNTATFNGMSVTSDNFKKSTAVSTGNFFNTSAQCRTFTVSQASANSCPSCLYNSNPNVCTDPDSNCNCNTRSDALCCTSASFSTWQGYTDLTSNTRRCSTYPRQNEGTQLSTTSTGQNNYRTCEDACQPTTSSLFNRRNCYNADGSSTTIVAGDEKKFCQCVVECETCVGSNGGCGKQDNGYDYGGSAASAVQNRYDNMFGTCSGPCTKAWRYPAPSAVSSDGTNAFTCAANPTSTDLMGFKGTCLPACVDCLAKAHARACPNGPIFGAGANGCPTVTPTQVLSIQSPFGFPDYLPYNAPACSTSGKFTTSTGFNVEAPPMDWVGFCEGGSCRICREGDKRCGSLSGTNQGIPQVCRNGAWVSEVDDREGMLENNHSLAALLAIAVFTSICMLLALGVLIASCITVKLLYYQHQRWNACNNDPGKHSSSGVKNPDSLAEDGQAIPPASAQSTPPAAGGPVPMEPLSAVQAASSYSV